jgi:hypothetical protein
MLSYVKLASLDDFSAVKHPIYWFSDFIHDICLKQTHSLKLEIV